MPNPAGPRFIQYFEPLLSALRELGSSAKPKEVYEWIETHVDVPEEEVDGTTKGGQSKFENKVGWARFYLSKAGMVDSEQRGVWMLTEKGRTATLTSESAYSLFKEVQDSFPRQPRKSKRGKSDKPRLPDDDENATAPDEKTYLNQDKIQEELVQILRSLSATGFEELSALLLRRNGFENVAVTGRAGDQGIDGEGYLTINQFLRTKVMFQCKRYEGTVGPDKIRDFRGAIQGRAERGIFLTTGTFTRGAISEAERENTTTIELVDIDRLLELLIDKELGVRETKALKIDEEFFSSYQDR